MEENLWAGEIGNTTWKKWRYVLAERWRQECDDEMTNLFGESQVAVEKMK